jgi:hypothetical protein
MTGNRPKDDEQATNPKMTIDEIQAELGWRRSMIYSLLKAPDVDKVRRVNTAGYARSFYRRERVLAVAQSPEGQAAQRRWDATLRGFAPNPAGPRGSVTLGANGASQQSLLGGCWSYSDTGPTSV